MKYLDLISDKIDYLFRRGKNAEDRCYDFFIRTVTFLLITLIVLCYGSFVHADASLAAAYGVDISKLNNSEWWSFNDTDSQYFADIYYGEGVVNGNLIPEVSNAWMNNVPYFSDFDSANKYIIADGCNIVGNSWVVITTIDKSLIDEGHVIFLANNGYQYISDGTYSINYYTINTNMNIYDRGSVVINQGRSSWDLGGYNNNIFFANVPLYAGVQTVEAYNYLKEHDFEDDLNYLYNINYFCYPDLELCSSAFLSNGVGNNHNFDPVESNVNHLYLDDIQIGLTAQNSNTDILSSQVVIGIDCDDWILNHIDDYSLQVNYSMHFKDTMNSDPNDPTRTYSQILPLRTFLRSHYSFGMSEIYQNMGLVQYYKELRDGGPWIIADATYKSYLPSPYSGTEQAIGDFVLKMLDAKEWVQVPYTVFDATFTVSCVLVDHVSDEQSANYIKEFDFVNNTTSIKSAEILRNNDPWEGESEPQQSPIIPSANNNSSGNGSSGGVNVKVDVSGQKIPIGVKTKQEIQVILDNYKDVNDTFMDSWEYLSDPNNENNFMSFISDETKELPAVDYLINGACAIFGLSIILFFLKVLLF